MIDIMVKLPKYERDDIKRSLERLALERWEGLECRHWQKGNQNRLYLNRVNPLWCSGAQSFEPLGGEGPEPTPQEVKNHMEMAYFTYGYYDINKDIFILDDLGKRLGFETYKKDGVICLENNEIILRIDLSQIFEEGYHEPICL